MLEVTGVSVAYGMHEALHDVALEVREGETVVILGSNGAGKTTLLNTITGLVRGKPGGRVTFRGEDITAAPIHEIVEKGIALVPEGRRLFGELTVKENLLLGAFPRRARKREDGTYERVMEIFPRLGERQHQLTRVMSGGEQQMVAIGRALMSNPTLLLLDEPSLGLSPLLTREVFRALEGLRGMAGSILLVEQNARRSLDIADRAYLIENGRILREGSSRKIAGDPEIASAYLGL